MLTQEETTRDILRKVRGIEIRTRKFVNDVLTGAYHSVFKGAGLNFAEVREYFPGDDVRSIDWNVTARMDRPFIKVYEEERELTVMLIVDLSASGDFGSQEQTKRELAAEMACVLAFSATRNNDKVGLILYTDQAEHYLPPRKGRQHALRLIRDILFFTPQKRGTHLPDALRYLNHVQRRHAVSFLISDFITPESLSWQTGRSGPATTAGLKPAASKTDDLQRMLKVTAQRHDLICIELHDPREEYLPNVGLIHLEDAETGEIIRLDTGNSSVRSMYAQLNRKRREALQQMFKRSGVDSFTIVTGQPYERILRGFFEKRRQRR